MTGQAKYKQFIKIAEKRTQRVLEDLEALGNCSNPATYLYSDHHLRQIFNAIDEKLANVKKRLQERSPYSHIPFRLKDPAMDDSCANTHLSYMGKMIPRTELFTQEYVIHVLETGSACFTDLEQIRATYMDKLGLDPCWTYPLGVGAHHGLVILPVWEGFLSLPFTDTGGDL